VPADVDHVVEGKPLRVLLVDPNANTPPYDRALAQALAAAGCQVELLTSRFLYEELPPPTGFALNERFFQAATSRLSSRLGLAGNPAARRLMKAAQYPVDWQIALGDLARRRPDVVHIQWAFQPELDLLFWRRVRALKIPLVYTVHNLVPHGASPGDAARYGRLYRAADALVVHSQRSAQALHDGWGIPPERIAVVPMGPMLEDWPALPREEARAQLGLPADAELILFAGLIEPYKGLEDLIAAFMQVAARRRRARLVIAGKPNEPFAPYEQRLRTFSLLDRTILDLRFLPEPNLAAYLCAADVVVLPYRSATSSAMLLSARRFGCRIVATDVGDLGEVIRNGETGMLVPPSTPAAIAEAIVRLLAAPGVAAELGRDGQAEALGPAGWSEAARRTLALYHSLARQTS
jgi:glycosyltransferase involved in cell wall biosynthesis